MTVMGTSSTRADGAATRVAREIQRGGSRVVVVRPEHHHVVTVDEVAEAVLPGAKEMRDPLQRVPGRIMVPLRYRSSSASRRRAATATPTVIITAK
jgi:hypothetical protein